LYGTGGPMSFCWLNEDEDRYRKVSIFTAIRPHQFEKVVENFFNALGKNIIEDVGIIDFNDLFKKIMSNLEVIPELKEKCWIEGDYVLTTPENYKLISLYRLYEHIFHYNQFEKDNDMANLYVK
jgi:hypothetical protein